MVEVQQSSQAFPAPDRSIAWSSISCGERHSQHMAAPDKSTAPAMVPQPTNFTWSVTDAANTVLHTGSGASFAYTPTVGGTQHVTVTATVGSIQLTGQAGLTVIPLGPPIRQIVSIAGNADGSPVMIGSDTSINIISYNPDGTPAPWALWLIPTGGGGDGTGGGPILLASGTQSAGQPGAPQQVATVGPQELADGSYTLTLTSSALDPTDVVADRVLIHIGNSNITIVTPSTTLVSLSWKDIGANAQYVVFRGTEPDFVPSSYNEIGDPLSPNFVDDQVVAGSTYFYKIEGSVDGISGRSLGEAPISIAVSNGQLQPIGTDGSLEPQGLIASPQDTVGESPAPTELTAAGINDLEILLCWKNNCKNPIEFAIFASNEGVAWGNPIAYVGADVTTYTVRFTNTNQFLTEGVNYSFKVVLCDSYAAPTGWDSNVTQGMVKIPSLSDTIIIVGGFLQPEAWLEQSWLMGNGLGNSVGTIWKDLIKKGYNVFMSAEADIEDNINHLGGSLNPNGTGPLYNELQHEITKGWAQNIGLIGYSHGGGLISNMAEQIHTDQVANHTFFSNVVFVGTIDAVEREVFSATPTPIPPALAHPTPLAASPGIAYWPTADRINYWEPNGAGFWADLITWPYVTKGMSMLNTLDIELPNDWHQTIDNDPVAIKGVELEAVRAFSEQGL